MNQDVDFAERAKQNEKNRTSALRALVVWGVLVIAIIFICGFHIHAFLGESKVVTGRLEDVSPGDSGCIKLTVDGTVYHLYKKNQYSNRSFGVIDNLPKYDLMIALDEEIGRDVSLEWVQVDTVRHIVQLSIAETEYVDKDISVSDFIAYEKTGMIVWGALLGVTIVLIWLIWKRIIR